LREARRLALEEKKSDWTDFLLNDITLRELASICRSDLTLVISEVEYNLLKDHFKIDESLLHYLPFLFEEYEIPTGGSLAGYAERRDFMTMGNWKHGPNRDSILYLKNEVWTEVRKRMPKAHMHVYGAYGKDKDLAMNDPSAGFFIHGWANSKGEAYSRHRVCLAPIRYGAGLKGKLIDAMRFGIPSVTTPIGAEGLAGDLPWNGFVSDDPSQMAALASELYNNKEVWENCQMRGETILRARFLGDLFEPGLIKVIAAIRASFEIHRTRNVMGALLWHHNAQSTKYLSKWIEVKNKFRDQNH
jgi:glycosyltransferase involved in cell wall biosynthesis